MPKKKPIIFIDANIYLGMYAPTSIHLKQLAPVLQGGDIHVFVTRQIVDEVERNKVGVFLTPAMDFAKNFTAVLPPLDPTVKSDDFEKTANGRHKKFVTDAITLAESIRDGSDNVSRVLEPIFSNAIEAQPAEIEKARIRKEFGNPPGKQGDPLGDQVTWEQLLAFVEPGQDIWIVSNDGDYWDRYKRDVLQLNPRLHRELRAKNRGGAIHCFTNLSDALTHMRKNSHVPKAALPPDSELKEIGIEEVKAAANTAVTTANTAFSYISVPTPIGCPKCGSISVAVIGAGASKSLMYCLDCQNSWW